MPSLFLISSRLFAPRYMCWHLQLHLSSGISAFWADEVLYDGMFSGKCFCQDVYPSRETIIFSSESPQSHFSYMRWVSPCVPFPLLTVVKLSLEHVKTKKKKTGEQHGLEPVLLELHQCNSLWSWDCFLKLFSVYSWSSQSLLLKEQVFSPIALCFCFCNALKFRRFSSMACLNTSAGYHFPIGFYLLHLYSLIIFAMHYELVLMSLVKNRKLPFFLSKLQDY